MFGKRPITFVVSLLSVFVLVLSLATLVSAKPRKKKRKESEAQRIARLNREAAQRQAILLGVSASQANAVNGSMDVNTGRDTSVRTSSSSTGSNALFVGDPEAKAPTASLSPATAGQILISEFRLRGPNGANDEFIEIYNNSGADHTVAALSGTGYGVAASDGTTRCSIPNGTVIPNRGHYLCT